MKNNSKWIVGFATGGFIGLIPFAPGTFGSLPGILIYYVMAALPLVTAFFFLAGVISLAVWVAGKGEQALGAKDPGCIVIDEIAGMTVTFFAIPFNFYLAIAGFLVFRLFDILKPFPIRYLEKRFAGGLGVVIDDVAAGIISNVVLQVILMVMKS
jgi:phosphatidylglycerophosphatase A